LIPKRPLPDHRSPAREGIARRFACLTLAFVLLQVLSACRPKPLTRADLESVTGELIEAARKATQGGAEIRVYVAPAGASPAVAGGKKETAGKDAGSATPPDRLLITLHDAGSLAALEAGWQGVARAHGLELLKNTTNPRVMRFVCRSEGRATHSMQVLLPGAGVTANAAAKALGNVAAKMPSGADGDAEPRLAVVIDDLGYEIPSAERLLALPFPLTLAVLPHLPHSSDVAAKARARGFEVLLHLPMESENAESPAEAIELRTGMSAIETARLLDAMLATVPGAVGVSNHQGSRATADPALMRQLVAALAARHLFLIDSRTGAGSVGYETARAMGLPAACRTEFLDDDQDPAAILQQLESAERRAREQGWALAIGHPYRVTLDVLTDALPDLEARGVRLVYASDVLQ
jgi:polysaccharide deacetylase 2 family uncharacterized protein YibQ